MNITTTDSGKCPFHHGQQPLREGLPALPPRIAALPRDERGYPIPFFVAYPDGKLDFRVADTAKLRRCLEEKLCWVCGQKLGAHLAFPIGPMCSVTGTTAEPPSHLECAEWSVRGCPFLSKPQMVRREHEDVAAMAINTPGVMIERNPGVTCIWVCKRYRTFENGPGKLFLVGDPKWVTWWREGRPATRAEVLESIKTGIPILLEQCKTEQDRIALNKQVRAIARLLPKDDSVPLTLSAKAYREGTK